MGKNTVLISTALWTCFIYPALYVHVNKEVYYENQIKGWQSTTTHHFAQSEANNVSSWRTLSNGKPVIYTRGSLLRSSLVREQNSLHLTAKHSIFHSTLSSPPPPHTPTIYSQGGVGSRKIGNKSGKKCLKKWCWLQWGENHVISDA